MEARAVEAVVRSWCTHTHMCILNYSITNPSSRGITESEAQNASKRSSILDRKHGAEQKCASAAWVQLIDLPVAQYGQGFVAVHSELVRGPQALD